MARWPQKPPLGSRINWAHPLAKSMLACLLLNENGGTGFTNIASGVKGAIGAGVVRTPWKTGPGLQFPNAGNCAISRPVNTNTLSIVARLSVFVMAAYGPIFESRDSGLTGLLISGASPGFITASWNGSAGEFNAAALMPPIGPLFTAAMTVSASATTVYTVTSAGIASHALPTSGNPARSISKWYFGRDAASGGQLGAVVESIHMYNRTLAPADIQQIAIDPYSMIVPPSTGRFFLSASTSVKKVPWHLLTRRVA